MSCNLITIDQSQDIPFTRVYSRNSEIGYLYARSSESYSQNGIGQDYIAIHHANERICFAVCDGVGQSFCGNLAAQFLGDSLVIWLARLPEQEVQDLAGLQIKATQVLADLTQEGSQMVREYDLPGRIPPLVKQALEAQKQYGSETVFVAGRLDFPKEESWQDARLIILWLGDTQAFLFDQLGNRIEFSEQWHNAHRWSTHLGLKGTDKVHIWSTPLDQISRLVVHSDGLKTVSDQLTYLINEKLIDGQISQLREAPTSDDVSLLCINRRPLRPVLLNIENPFRLDSFTLTWDSPEEPEMYTLIELFTSPVEEKETHFQLSGSSTSYRLRNRPPGSYAYRLCAYNGDISGEDSDEVSTQVKFSLRAILSAATVLVIVVLLFLVGRK